MADFRRSRKESVKESDLGLTYKKNKTVKVKHKTSGKRLIIVDKPAVRKEYEKIGYFAESINEIKMYSNADAIKKVKSMQKTSGAKIYKVEKVKASYKGKPVTMYNLHTKNKNHSTNQNPYGLDMMKGAYLIPVKESVNEANNMDKIKDIVKKKSYKRIGGVIVDMQTANAILQVYKALGGANKKKYEKLSISKMASIAYKLIK